MSKIDAFYKIDLLHTGDFVAAPNGDFAVAKGLVNLKQKLFHRLITVKGSIVHRPDFGVGVKLYQNDVSSISKQRDLANDIKKQFEEEEAVDRLKSVRISNIKENGTFEIIYSVEVSGGKLLEESVDPFGELTI